jgi:hypothetical protein
MSDGVIAGLIFYPVMIVIHLGFLLVADRGRGWNSFDMDDGSDEPK